MNQVRVSGGSHKNGGLSAGQSSQVLVTAESPFQNYRDINLIQHSGKRSTQSIEGKNHTETQEVYMSLERKAGKKQFTELSTGKRENHFSKIPITADPKTLKMKSSTSVHNDTDSDRFRKATLSPP
jgi:hypothetical protein